MKNDAIEMRFLYALIRTYWHLRVVKRFSYLKGYTYLKAIIRLVETTSYRFTSSFVV